MKYLKDSDGFDFSREFGFTGSATGRDDPKLQSPRSSDEYGDGFAKGGSTSKGRKTHYNADGSKKVVHADGTVMHHRLDGSVETHDSSEYAHRVRGYAVGGPAMGAPPAGPGALSGGMPGGAAPQMPQMSGPPGGAAFPSAMGGINPASAAAAADMGGDKEPTISMPMSTATKMAKNLVAEGAQQGARAAVGQVAELGRRQLAAKHQMQPAAPQASGMGRPSPGQRPAMATQAQTPMQGPQMAKGGHMTAAERHALPKSDFALPGERYPVNDEAHARNALARVAQHGTPSEQERVRAAVHRKFPGIGKK